MLILICLLLVLIAIICFAKSNNIETQINAVEENTKYEDDLTDWNCLGYVCTVMFVIIFVFLIVLAIQYSKKMALDDKIVLYQEENTKIETQINAVVEEYKKYESETLKEFSPEKDMNIIFIKYPELKTNELVKKQIDIHIENNKKIKELKTKKCNYKVLGWWIFFNIGIK